MRWWKFSSIFTLAVALGALGCGGNSSSAVAINISPTSASVVTNTTQLFASLVTGSSNTNVTWTVTCATGVTANTCGSIDSTGLYTAPATIPTTTSNGTTTAAPAVTITGTAQADTTKTATATVTIITGISITITPTTATVGTGEHFPFAATVTNPGCNVVSTPTCDSVTWSVSTTLTGIGSIDASTGVYTAPATVPSPSVVTVTATSVTDTTVTATAAVTIVTASSPTVTSVSPNNTALGGLFQDIYISGTNFISTNNVYINGAALPSTNVAEVSSSVIRARIPDVLLAVPPPSNVFQITVSEQTGTPQTCSDASLCQITVTGVRPGVIGPSPDSISQSNGGVLSFNVDGGFFGTATNPAVTATYDGQLRAIQLSAGGTTSSTRQLSVTIGGGSNPSDLGTPGLHPVAVKSAGDSTKFAVTNLAVQPNYNVTAITPTAPNRIVVGSASPSAPSDVAVNPTTGIAVVANTGSNDISLIDLTAGTPAVVANICTVAVGQAFPCPTSGPTSVSVDYIRNIALVVNSTSKTIAVVDLNARAVTYVTQQLTDTPGAVGINPVTGRALIAMQTKNYGMLMDLTQNPPAFVGVVSISTGPKTRVAVEPHLNWALATPGGVGSLGIVDLSRQSCNAIATLVRSSDNVVQVTVQTAASCQSSLSAQSVAPPLSVQLGDAVFIQNTSDASFEGFYSVTAIGPSSAQFSYTQTGATQPPGNATGGQVNYSQPVATVALTTSVQGIGINAETQQAVLVDPTTGGVVSFFSLIDQSVSTLALRTNNAPEVGTVAAAYNPLTNTVVAVNPVNNTLSVIDPTTPKRLNDGNLYTTQPGPVAVGVDPGTDTAVVVNQTDNSVSVLNLGSIKSFSITETSPKTVVTTSTLASAPAPPAQTLTVIGMGLTCVNSATNLVVRLDGNPLQTLCVGNGNRQLTAIVPPSLLSAARRFALDVADTSGNVTNAEDFTVEKSVDVSSACSATPLPSGVSVDPVQNIAAVSLFGCNSVALINMGTGTGQTVAVGTNPIGVAVLPRLNLVVVANDGSQNASVVDELQDSVVRTIATGAGSIGAAADQDTAEVAIANSVSNTVSVVNALTGAVNSISTGQQPVAVGFNYVNHQVAIAEASSNALGISDATGSSANSFPAVIGIPTSVVYDPVPSDCGSTSGTTPNTVGCFIVNSSTGNVVYVVDPVTFAQTSFRIGINPTAIAYNFLTSTLVSANTASHTVTVADFLARRIRAVLALPPALPDFALVNQSLSVSGSLQFAMDVHPFANTAVIADTGNARVLFIPLPR